MNEPDAKDWDAWAERYDRKIDYIVARHRVLADRLIWLARLKRRIEPLALAGVVPWLKP